uniref:Uncharacterized protein n=1 Tax=Solanum tuberosum TaxID=4113 RepID=M1CGJ1_SOLTU
MHFIIKKKHSTHIQMLDDFKVYLEIRELITKIQSFTYIQFPHILPSCFFEKPKKLIFLLPDPNPVTITPLSRSSMKEKPNSRGSLDEAIRNFMNDILVGYICSLCI